MVRSLARWVVFAAGSVLLGLVLIALALYWHFVRSGPEPRPWHQAALADFIREGHLEQHIRRMRRVYAARREALLGALHRHFGGHAIVLGDAAGMHLVVRFDVPDIARRARRRGVALRTTRAYYAGDAPANEFILRFSDLGERVLAEAVRRLASAGR